MNTECIDSRNGIERHQISLLVFFIPLVFKMSMLPSQLSNVSGVDALTAIFLLISTEILHLTLVYAAVKLGGVSMLAKRIGRVATFIIVSPLIFVALIKTLVFGIEIINYVDFYLFYNTTSWGIKVVFLLTLFYVACGGPRTFGRLAELSLLFLPFIVFLGLIFGRLELNFEYVLPFYADGFYPSINGAQSFVFWAFDFSPLIFFKLNSEKKPGRRKVPFVAIGALIVTITLVSLYALLFANYGLSAVIVDNAFARLAAFNVVTTQVGSIEWPSVVLWLLSATLCLGIKVYAASRTMQLVKVPPRISTGIIMVVVGALMFYVVKDISVAMELAKSWVRFVVFGCEILVTFVVLFVLLWLKIKEERRVGQKESANEAR